MIARINDSKEADGYAPGFDKAIDQIEKDFQARRRRASRLKDLELSGDVISAYAIPLAAGICLISIGQLGFFTGLGIGVLSLVAIVSFCAGVEAFINWLGRAAWRTAETLRARDVEDAKRRFSYEPEE